MRTLVLILVITSFIVSSVNSLHAQGIPLTMDDHQSFLVVPDTVIQAPVPETEDLPAARLDMTIRDDRWIPEPIGHAFRWPSMSLTMQITVKRQTARTLKVNTALFNALYNKPKVDERAQIRAEWTKTIGFDVWKPYFLFKEIEDWFKERFSIKIFGLKGKPQFGGNKFIYVFKGRF